MLAQTGDIHSPDLGLYHVAARCNGCVQLETKIEMRSTCEWAHRSTLRCCSRARAPCRDCSQACVGQTPQHEHERQRPRCLVLFSTRPRLPGGGGGVTGRNSELELSLLRIWHSELDVTCVRLHTRARASTNAFGSSAINPHSSVPAYLAYVHRLMLPDQVR